MTTAATSLLGLALPVTGELSGTWGDTVNNSLTSLLDTAIAGTTTLSADADVTLTTTTLASNQARQAVILWTAGGTATRTITAPAQSKTYIVINKTSSTQSIKIVGAGPTTGVTIAAGTAALVAWNGVDFVTVSVMAATGVLPVVNGGTGVTTSTGSGSNVLSTSPTLVTPILGTPTSGTLTNATGLPLTTGVTGTLPIANGGTGLTSGNSGGVLAFTATGTLVSSTVLASNTLVVGGGAGAAPSTTPTAAGVITFLGTPTSANLAALVTDETGSGSLVFGASPSIATAALNNPTVTNYIESVVAIGTVGSSSTLSLTNGTVQTATLTASTACTFTMPTNVAGKSFILLLKQAASTGNGTATFTGVKWNSTGAPIITATAGTMDILTFVADGTNWYGSATQGYTP